MPHDRQELINKLWESQNGCCFIGGEPIDLALHKVEIDHIIPRAKGGKDEESNYALVCEYHNRTKSDSDLRVARCMAKYESIKDQYSVEGPKRPNLGDFLREFGGGKSEIRAQIDDNLLRYSLPRTGAETYTTPIFDDKLSKMSYAFLELPIEYLHHDDRINPRAVGIRIRRLIREFLEGRPQLHIALGWGFIEEEMR